MSFTLNINIGGLCLFVQRAKANTGLHVLMLADTMGKSHSPSFARSFWDTPIDFSGQDLDLRTGPNKVTGDTSSTPTAKSFSGLLAVSKATAKTVSKNHLGSSLSTLVAARIILPLPANPPIWYERVGVVAQFGGTPPDMQMGKVSGRLMLQYEVDKSITIMGQDFTATADIVFTNLPPNSPRPGDPTPYHPANTLLDHASMYLALMDSGALQPTFYTTEDYGTPPASGATSAPMSMKASSKAGLMATPVPGVDPVQCTLGGGCPPDDPNC